MIIPTDQSERRTIIRDACRSLNDAKGKGGQKRLAQLLDLDSRTIRNRIADPGRISVEHIRAIRDVLREVGKAQP